MLVSQTTGEKLTEQYTYYLNGNQKTKTSNGETTTYEYDAMNRLVKENDTVYSFDDFGNRATMTSGADTVTYEYDLNNRLTESNEVSGGISKITSYSYDNNGNQTIRTVMTTKPYSDQASKDYFISGTTNENIALYSYNCYNQLIEADTNGVVSNYTYSPDGLRHSKTVGENTTTFVYDNSNIVEEITSDGANKYYRGFEIIKNGDNLYYIYNGQGDVTILTDNAGTTVADYSFDAYGNQSEENEVYNPFGYRGEYTDEETGFIYLRARYYDTETGRFINEDPIRDGLNWYVYCNGNPIKYADPSGLGPHDHFDTPSDMLKDWAWNYVAEIDYTMFEQGSAVYTAYDENGNWYCSYTETVIGTPHSLDDSDLISARGLVPKNAKYIGIIHGHPHGHDFSENDKKHANQTGEYIFVAYRNDNGTADVLSFSGRGNGNIRNPFSPVRNAPIKELTNRRKIELRELFKDNWYKHIPCCKFKTIDTKMSCSEMIWPNNTKK